MSSEIRLDCCSAATVRVESCKKIKSRRRKRARRAPATNARIVPIIHRIVHCRATAGSILWTLANEAAWRGPAPAVLIHPAGVPGSSRSSCKTPAKLQRSSMRLTKFFSVMILMARLVRGDTPSAASATTLSLAGEWRFSSDAGQEGVQKEYFNRDLPQRIALPGSTDAQPISALRIPPNPRSTASTGRTCMKVRRGISVTSTSPQAGGENM